jgi:UDP-glucuronate 4-epimerase
MHIVVTGAAGFIGSHLSERLLADENTKVTGIDARLIGDDLFARNLRQLIKHPRFRLIEGDLIRLPLTRILQDADIIYHLAGMPGVRSSWGSDFHQYTAHNIDATQHLLEACQTVRRLQRFIYASTSSIYGEKSGAVREDAVPEPLSPYGVSKLTGEYLCKVYARSSSIPIVILRFFTVYGPRQRPDMAFHRFIRSMIKDEPITINGDGLQTRDFTYILDGVEGIARAAYVKGIEGETINIGGKERASVLDAVAILEQLFGRKAKLQFVGKPRGEPRHTWADISKAERMLGYHPQTSLRSGLEQEVRDLIDYYANIGSK